MSPVGVVAFCSLFATVNEYLQCGLETFVMACQRCSSLAKLSRRPAINARLVSGICVLRRAAAKFTGRLDFLQYTRHHALAGEQGECVAVLKYNCETGWKKREPIQ